MLLHIFRTALILAGVSWLAVGGTAAAASAIKDEGHVFSPQVKEKAEKDIENIRRDDHKELIIEFVPSVPEGNWWNKFKKWMLYSKDPKNRQRFYEDWAKRSARAAGPQSIYVLIVQEPAPLHVEIAAGRDAQMKGGLTPADCKKLQQSLQTAFQKGNYDAGLEQAIKDIRRTLRDHRDAVDEGFPWGELGSLMAIMLGFWLCLQLMEKFLCNQDPERAVPLEAAGYGAGGSYLAGLYTALTNNGVQELFRSLRSREHPTLEPVTTRAAPSAGDQEAVLTDTDYGGARRGADSQDYLHDNS